MRPEQIDHSSRKTRYFFDTSNGEVLGSRKEKDDYVAKGADSDNIRPLNALILDPNFDQTYPSLSVSAWDKERYIACGKWIRALIRFPGNQGIDLSQDLLLQAERLGISPKEQQIRRELVHLVNFMLQ